jgi:protein-S-isoprenylcysteine O-methyltransferase Ste14
LAGASAISWAVLGVWQSDPADRWTPLRLIIAALNLCVGVLFVVRTPARRHGTLRTALLALPSLLVGGGVVKLTVSPADWPGWAEAIAVAGGGLALMSLVTLGRSFAIFPAARAIVDRGPYRLVRHPAYLGELLILSSAALAGASERAWLIGAIPLGLAAIVLRIAAEERFLRTGSEYAAYAGRVRWRLVPGIW